MWTITDCMIETHIELHVYEHFKEVISYIAADQNLTPQSER